MLSETLKRKTDYECLRMAVETQNIKLSLATLEPFHLPLPTKIKTRMEIATDKFHDWCNNSKKVIVSDKDGNVVQTEYHFPDEIIIKKKLFYA